MDPWTYSFTQTEQCFITTHQPKGSVVASPAETTVIPSQPGRFTDKQTGTEWSRQWVKTKTDVWHDTGVNDRLLLSCLSARLQVEIVHQICTTSKQPLVNNSVYSCLRQLYTCHCPHLLLCVVLRLRASAAPVVQQSIAISYPPVQQQQTCYTLLQRDRRTDTGTICRPCSVCGQCQ